MTGTEHWREPRRRGDILLGLIVTFCVIGIMLIAAAFARQTVREMRDMETATSDNAQWTLPQVEVEYLAFLYALEETTDTGVPDLEEIRLRYDVLFSRIETLSESRIFQDFLKKPEFGAALADVRMFLIATLPLIDGPNRDMIDQLPVLRDHARNIRHSVRSLSVSGLTIFAEQSELRRLDVAYTLSRLAIVTGFLFLALTTLSVFLFMVYRKTQARGLDLEQANQRMNTILSASLDGVVVTDTYGRVQEFNSAAEAIFGLPQARARGRSIGELLVPDHLRDAHEEGLRRVRAGGEHRVAGHGRVQLEALRSDGSEFPIELALQTAFDGRQQVYVGFIRDISERVRARSELVDARDRALAGEKAKADFLTVMSHEIRTPLNGLLGNLSLLEETQLDPQQAEFVRNMGISGRILTGHVDTVLDISRLEAGHQAVARDAVDLEDLIQDLVDGQRSIAENQGSAIDWRWVGAPSGWVISDAQMLQQVLLNLIGNAIKFTENGRIMIEIEALDRGDAPRSNRRCVEFRVSDTGTGIAEADLDRVFEDFQTSDVSFGRRRGGTGLGLGIARRLVHRLGGKIGAESVLGEGSTFWFRLPLELADRPDQQEAETKTRSLPDRLSVLVVEDNSINRQVAQSMLKREGHRVTCAVDGRSGVAAAEATRFDLILMDISMPVMDGLEATRRIRLGGGSSAEARIIALSANVLPQDQERYFDAGIDGFLGKPLTLDDLRRALSGVTSLTGKPRPGDGILDPARMGEIRESLGGAGTLKLLQRFLDEATALMARLQTFGDGPAELEDLATACHKLAGSAAVFGAFALQRALLEQQHRLTSQDTEQARARVAELDLLWTQTRVALGHANPEMDLPGDMPQADRQTAV